MKTALEWYSDKLLEILGDNVNLFTKEQTLANHYALEQAKEMEKIQIIDAFIGYDSDTEDNLEVAEQYYNETFKQQEI